MSELKIGFGRINLDAPTGIHISGYYSNRRAQGALDDLTASVLAVSDGENTALVYTFDQIGIAQTTGDEMRRIISERTGVPFEAVFYACTHTHTAPEISKGLYDNDPDYNSILFRRLADSANEALADMSPAEVFTARGTVDKIAFIRRFRMKDGSTRTNPGYANPDIDHPIGTPDFTVQLVKITREGKDDIAVINYQVHPDVIGGCKYSADWPGFVRRSFEGAVPGTKCLFFNGTQGDTNHSDYIGGKRNRGYHHAQHMGLCIAGEAMKLYTYADKADGDKVGFIASDLEVPLKITKPEDLPQAEKYIELHESGRREEIPFEGMEYTTVIAEAYRLIRLKNGPTSLKLHINSVRFGDVAITGIPGEPFTAIGRGIKEGSPFGMTIVCCCSNGYEGYFPTTDALTEGGYEARSSQYMPGIAESLIEASIENLKKIY